MPDKVLHSWMYPQSVLTASLISVLSSSTVDGELEFLRKRQVAWEESFRDLYYMLRKNICGLFYVCTPQFVVMFTGGDGSGRSKFLCNAYISQSTWGLRSLLREQLSFEPVATEDLVELSEIVKQNLGQTRRIRSFSDVDNSPESLLVFSGNYNVHGLYDILFNYRSLLISLSGVDVPVLRSPMPFQNSALSSPHVYVLDFIFFPYIFPVPCFCNLSVKLIIELRINSFWLIKQKMPIVLSVPSFLLLRSQYYCYYLLNISY